MSWFFLVQVGIDPGVSHLGGKIVNHYTTDARQEHIIWTRAKCSTPLEVKWPKITLMLFFNLKSIHHDASVVPIVIPCYRPCTSRSWFWWTNIWTGFTINPSAIIWSDLIQQFDQVEGGYFRVCFKVNRQWRSHWVTLHYLSRRDIIIITIYFLNEHLLHGK